MDQTHDWLRKLFVSKLYASHRHWKAIHGWWIADILVWSSYILLVGTHASNFFYIESDLFHIKAINLTDLWNISIILSFMIDFSYGAVCAEFGARLEKCICSQIYSTCLSFGPLWRPSQTSCHLHGQLIHAALLVL